jgi:RNA polymerase sigma-70 factor (ECF subfamily)
VPVNRAAPTPDPNEVSRGFGSTEWSLVLAAGKDDSASDALNSLCRKYWRPMYVHIRRMGVPSADAEDVTQRFFVYLIEKDWISQADPNRGSFRAFLRTLLNNYLANHQRAERAVKRIRIQVSIDTEEGERALAESAARAADPVLAFDQTWARTVLQAAWDRLAREQAAAGKERVFETLRPFVTQPASTGDYDRLGPLLGLQRSQMAVFIHRLSRRYADLIRAEVAETLADRAEIESELRHLVQITAV